MKEKVKEASENLKKVGLLGGTFDPIHMTHLIMAETARVECNLDEVWFIPAQQPPHKLSKPITSGADRIEMVKLAIEDIPYFKLSTVEFLRSGPSYTVDTIHELASEHPDVQFFFILGADMVENLPTWHRIVELMKKMTFISMNRPGWQGHIPEMLKDHIIPVELLPSHISSTLIRSYRRQGRSIRFLVPEKVFQYIEEKHLYE